MTLKDYQEEVLLAIENYLNMLEETKDLNKAYTKFWYKYGKIDITATASFASLLQPYINITPGAPNVTVKVPTAGGKTLIACAALQKIFDKRPKGIPQVVTWFVPSDTILTQTLQNLQDATHPYRQRIIEDFGSCVNVIGKEEALMAQGLHLNQVRENLTILVLSVQSFADNRSTDNLRARRQNENFKEYINYRPFSSHKVSNAENPSLLQVLAQLNPVVIIDESHKFSQSDLRQELQRELNPAFVLNLTATPRKKSNVICFIDSYKLKNENMVKLPVIVHNNKSMAEVMATAVAMQQSLEIKALKQRQEGGDYVRPIVLFQAQPKTDDDSETFDKIKKKLLNSGIPAKYIAIKTAKIDELKGRNLFDENCNVRYIITVNALNEGWDCSFAYILATVANRSSSVEVEQILGRILRQPNAREQRESVLNASYVFTNSADFQGTLESIVDSLNKAGFSPKDCWADEETETGSSPSEQSSPQENQMNQNASNSSTDDEDERWFESDEPLQISEVESQESDVSRIVEQMAQVASERTEQMKKDVRKSKATGSTILPGSMQNQYAMIKEFADIARSIRIPMFAVKVNPDAFGDKCKERLTKESLTAGFNLLLCDKHIDFTTAMPDARQIDLSQMGPDEYRPAIFRLSDANIQFLKESINSMDNGKLVNELTLKILQGLHFDDIKLPELKKYIEDVLSALDIDSLHHLYIQIIDTTDKFKRKVEALRLEHRRKTFKQRLDSETVFLSKADNVAYSFPEFVSVTRLAKGLRKGLYREEPAVNGFEKDVISAIIDEDNVLFWHRNDANTGFYLNGFIYHYPDFIVYLKSGKILLVEPKGDHLKNNDSSLYKMELGQLWEKDNSQFRYFMVFESQPMRDGVTIEQLLRIIRSL